MKTIFTTGELLREQVVSKMETTAADGKHYLVDYYNLDMILSIGYRVNSIHATMFRQWANTVLKKVYGRASSCAPFSDEKMGIDKQIILEQV